MICRLQWQHMSLMAPQNMYWPFVKGKRTWPVDSQLKGPVKMWIAFLCHDDIMKTSSNGNIFRVTGPLCGEFTGHRWIPAQRPVTRNFDVFFYLNKRSQRLWAMNKRLSKQSWDWWFETPPCPLWRHSNIMLKNSVRDLIDYFICQYLFRTIVLYMSQVCNDNY